MLSVAKKILVLLLVWVVWTYHRGTLAPVKNPIDEAVELGQFIPRTKGGINQLLLVGGSDYSRGLKAGELTKGLLYRQERELVDRLKEILPGLWVAHLMSFASMTWFYGLDNYVDREMLEEMYGVSAFADKDFDSFADGYTRQLAYHALHEVGQHFVDFGSDVYGCTVFAIPVSKNSSTAHWMIGRNFDFEGGRIFDEEKILKWVFPKKGNAYLSVIWAGMVGGVTGVNNEGLYISINAAGSKDFRRLGMPTTLLLTKVLQNANSLEQAIEVFEATPTFITDIFVLVDSKTQRAVKIEKSPLRTRVIELKDPSVITNQLDSEIWAADPVNNFKRYQLTSEKRFVRGLELLRQNQETLNSDLVIEGKLVSFLRDHSDSQGPLPLGHRASIDPLIATHSVIFNSGSQVLYVNEGPGSHGRYLGFDLQKSFAQRRPVLEKVLPANLDMSVMRYAEVRRSEKTSQLASKLARTGECKEAKENLVGVIGGFRSHYLFLKAEGDIFQCEQKTDLAKARWQDALKARPAYSRERAELEKLVSSGVE